MSIVNKDKNGNIKKIASHMTQRVNARWFPCKRVVEDGIEYYDIPTEATEYYKDFKSFFVYSLGFFEPNTTSSPKLRYGKEVLSLKDFTKEEDLLEVGKLNGVYQMFTKDLSDNKVMYFCGTTNLMLLESLIVPELKTNLISKADDTKDIEVNGRTKFNGIAEFAKQVQIGKDCKFKTSAIYANDTGVINFYNDVTITDTKRLNVGGQATFSSNVNIEKTLKVNRISRLDDTEPIIVQSDTWFQSNVGFYATIRFENDTFFNSSMYLNGWLHGVWGTDGSSEFEFGRDARFTGNHVLYFGDQDDYITHERDQLVLYGKRGIDLRTGPNNSVTINGQPIGSGGGSSGQVTIEPISITRPRDSSAFINGRELVSINVRIKDPQGILTDDDFIEICERKRRSHTWSNRGDPLGHNETQRMCVNEYVRLGDIRNRNRTFGEYYDVILSLSVGWDIEAFTGREDRKDILTVRNMRLDRDGTNRKNLSLNSFAVVNKYFRVVKANPETGKYGWGDRMGREVVAMCPFRYRRCFDEKNNFYMILL